jgi:hypothetical protein
MARGVSSPAGDDKGSSPLTSAAFLKNCCTKKLLFLLLPKIDFHIDKHSKGITFPSYAFIFRTCSHWICAWIFEHNFDEGKAKKRKHTIVW